MSRCPSGLVRTVGRSWVKTKNSSASIRATRSAPRSRTRWRRAPVAAWPASIQPPNAITSVVRPAGGSRSNSTWSMVHLVEELSHVHEQARGVVALHGVAGALDAHPARTAQAAGQLLRVLVVEHVALRAAHDERRAFHRVHRGPEDLTPARLRLGIDSATVTLIVLPHVASVRHATEVV